MKIVKKVMIALMPFAIAIGGAAASGFAPRNTPAEYRAQNNPNNECLEAVTEQENCSPMGSNPQCTIAGTGEWAFLQGTSCAVELKRP